MAQTLEHHSFAQTEPDDGEVTLEKILFTVEEIVHRIQPVRVVAFGSRARGDHRRTSDLDLAVIVESYDPKVDERPIWRADIDVWMDLDLLIYDLNRDELLRDSPMSLQAEVKREGVVLFDRATGNIDRAAAARLVQ